ncbi:DNA-binding transcriptional regulator, LacI/PurR family [Abditibacterium utsteinense]|uniref:DNA-binding transcriptional regulator, LacI/PurR family n=1 Tax=Abditibacterium utsteinense TaxID=1960156 RepID=A0A2S8STV0_9BACT|nr:LacI family DNA-binding transcriptional regulator [Abditibacterium utsteinense]PQV64220.1 DNA-binding transcriptional regulator, LacI/PurR family [Abditibacterium utsteinense]
MQDPNTSDSNPSDSSAPDSSAPEVAKHRLVREAINHSIRSGEVRPGERLPAERELARLHGVSYMTARRAVTEMVEAGLLERRGREGTFVRAYGASRLSTTVVHLIYPDFDTPSIKAMLRFSLRECENRGWKTHIIRLNPSNERLAVRALQDGELAMVLVEGPELQGALGEAMQKADGRAVLIGNRLDGVGVPSVLADDAQAVRLAVRHLREKGHEKIALLSSHPRHAIDRVQIATWRSSLSAIEREVGHAVPQDLIVINTPRHESETEFTLEGVKAYFERGGKATALITPNDEMALATLAACRASEKNVPEAVSIVNSGDSPMMTVAHPTVTCIDVHLEAHIAQAMEFLDAAVQNLANPFDRLRLIEPHLIERESVASSTAQA